MSPRAPSLSPRRSRPRLVDKPVRGSIGNPYANTARPWVKGEIHAHVCKARNSSTTYDDGVPARTIYKDAAEEGLQFVCMSVDATHQQGGADRFGDVGLGKKYDVIGIPGREIQNNFFYPEDFISDYFHEAGAEYLHVLTIGEDGISLCLHPTYYELVRPKPGGGWNHIKKALLSASSSSTLGKLHVSGIEVYNGFTMRKLLDADRVYEYSDYDEHCWDEMLMAGRRYWGFCGNDSFFHSSNDLASFSPLGVTYALAPAGATTEDIVQSLRLGRFYASTGVCPADTPLTATVDGFRVQVEARAATEVNWTAKIFQRIGRGWHLTSLHVPGSDRAVFTTQPAWRYIRVQCQSISDPWQRPWLQPITNNAFF